MQDEHLYNWQSPAKQAEYEQWLAERYGPQAHDWIAASQARFDGLSDVERQAAMDRLKVIESDLVEAYRRGLAVDAEALAPVLERHREWVGYMWNRPCPPGAYANLAEMYIGHPDFVARFDGMAEGFAAWLAAAMKHHAEGLGEAA
ncbi:MAG: TipAS antibiotic-recognition domain-containing protein [Asticcacaulis sp.]|nr:TipAS antibiotic-recognition domain-containing protein [Asticcacaulis sp.]